MTDADAASVVLRWFYDNQDKLGWSNPQLTPEVFEGRFDITQLHRVIGRLREDELVSATYSQGPMFDPNFPLQPLSIKRAGIDAIERTITMTDKELRTRILERLYRQRDDEQPPKLDAASLGLGNEMDSRVNRVVQDLKGLNLVRAYDALDGTPLSPEITPQGVDVVEGEAESPVAVNQTFNISGPVTGSQFGPGSTMNNKVTVHLQELAQAVMEAEGMPKVSKRTALERLHALASDGTIGNAAGVAGVILAMLEKLGGG